MNKKIGDSFMKLEYELITEENINLATSIQHTIFEEECAYIHYKFAIEHIIRRIYFILLDGTSFQLVLLGYICMMNWIKILYGLDGLEFCLSLGAKELGERVCLI